MKNNISKRRDLIGAILNGDKEKLKKLLQEDKPERWLCIELEYEKKIIKVDNKEVREEEVMGIINELEKEFCVKIILMKINVQDAGSRFENWIFLESPEFLAGSENVTLKL
ncbi:MAG TPA: hypothetical protein PKA77_11300 [Chitinophagaceae bacterium]|jgi:transposase|nr:hypothetical protein [Chitinophagaceae bacterium]HMU59464.1 hypothetical protein [Chitinophagaceae bacterium]